MQELDGSEGKHRSVESKFASGSLAGASMGWIPQVVTRGGSWSQVIIERLTHLRKGSTGFFTVSPSS